MRIPEILDTGAPINSSITNVFPVIDKIAVEISY